MDKLPMCRICLVRNLRMFVVVNKNLHELYEKLTDIPFVTEDSRPMLVCFVCCTLLKKCYRFKRKCLEAEEWFSQIMNGDYELKPLINQDYLEIVHGFIKTPIHTIDIVEVGQIENIDVKEEFPNDGQQLNDIILPKETHQSDDDLETVNLYDSYLDIEYEPARLTGAESGEVLLMELKTEVEEQDTSVKKRKSKKTNRALVPKIPKIDKRKTKLKDATTAELKKKLKSTLKNTRTTQIRATERDTGFGESSKYKQRSIHREAKLEQRTPNCEKLYKCDVCQNSFSRKNTLKSHIRIHTGEKPFVCNLCQHSFAKNSALTIHIRRHTGEKPFKCDTCARNFIDKASLSRHKRIHAGEKPYKCEVCQHGFNQMYHLKRHSMIHTDKKLYQCDICQRSFMSKNILLHHIRQHTGEKPFKCNECQRTFSHEGSLRNHVRIHTGEKPYKCDLCWRSFRNKSFLARHILKHVGEKPYKCDVCHHSFTHRGNLKNHLNTHLLEKT